MKLLFVEEHPEDVVLSVAELRRFGFALEHRRVDTLEEAEAALGREEWSAVVSDYHFQGFSGADVLRAVRRRSDDLPFIVLSSDLDEETATALLRAGANDCVAKERRARFGPTVQRELRQLERRKVAAKLEQADRLASLSRLAATIAHEFNNVLMGILPFVEVIRRGKHVESSLDHIAGAVVRGRRISEDILHFTQPAEPMRVALDVAPWIDNIVVEARTLLPPSCVIEASILENLCIDGDPNQLRQVFTNLILNARDAMLPAGGGTLSITVQREIPGARVRTGTEGPLESYAHFAVSDTGSGMSDETLRRIFEPLFTTKRNGTGLGLPVAHQFVQRHGGEIFAESTLGEGTTFHIFLPLADVT